MCYKESQENRGKVYTKIYSSVFYKYITCACVSLSLFSLSFPIKRYLRPRREDFCTGTTSSTLSFSSSLFTGCCCCSASSMSASAASPSSAMVVVSLLSSFSRIFAKFFFVSKVRLFSEPGVELVFVLRVLFDPGVAPTGQGPVSRPVGVEGLHRGEHGGAPPLELLELTQGFCPPC